MTTAMLVAAALAFSFALGSLVRQVDGATLRRWRLSRGWDVSRLAREFIKAADEPLATLRGLMHMINAWERDARRPSERYWLLYFRVFPECTAETSVTEATAASPIPSEDPSEIGALAATVSTLEQQIARLSRRLEELSRGKHGEEKPRERSTARRHTGSARWRGTWTPSLWTALVASFGP